MNKIILKIGGMSCSGCSSGLEKYLNKQKGIISASVNLVIANATIEYTDEIKINDINNYVKEAGFESLGEFNLNNNKEEEKNKLDLYILVVLSISVMYIIMASMFGLPKLIDSKNNPIVYSLILLFLSIPALFIGKDIIVSGYKNLIHKTSNMDTLVTLSIISSFLYSLFGTVEILIGNNNFLGNLYYEAVIMVITFIKLGRYIDSKSKNKTLEAIKSLVQLTPSKASIIKNNKEVEVTIDMIKVGDIVTCKPGEKIAVDGIITKGSTNVNEAFITGESLPSYKEIDSNVIAGSINYDGYIEYKAIKIGKNSTISEIVRIVVEANNTKPKISRLADKISSIFVPSIVVISIIAFIFWLLIGYSFGFAVNTFVTLLVIACPCALGLATPLAVVIASGVSAKDGILIKTSAILETIYKANTIVFDKTGTLTKGKLKVSQIYNYSNMKEEEMLRIVGSIESKSEHPIALAITEYCKNKNIEFIDVDNFKIYAGLGVKSKIDENNIIIGNKKFIEKENIFFNDSDEEKLTSDGNSILYVVIDNKVISLIGVSDIIKDESIKTIKELTKRHLNIVMLTGDNEKTALDIARKIGVDNVFASVLPSDKKNIIKKLKEKNNLVMMVGDGINDASALVEADVGISLSNGTDVAIDSADVVLVNNDLFKIIDLIDISKKTIINIKENLFWAFAYNIAMIPIAFGILIKFNIIMNPMIASFAMTLSSLTVVFNALRLRKIKLIKKYK